MSVKEGHRHTPWRKVIGFFHAFRKTGMPDERPPVPVDVPEKMKYWAFISLGSLMIVLAFLFNSPQEIWAGSIVILTSSANLLTDYFQLANIGATFLNVGLMTFLSLAIVRFNKVKITGSVMAAIFTVAGFSFFGKNLFNSIPIMLGVYLYAKVSGHPYNRFLLQALFGTALSPLVSEFAFNLQLPVLSSLLLGIFAGVLAGFLLPPLSIHFLRFHQGFNLYNIGFTAGIIGMFFLAVLRGFGIQIETVSVLSSGNNTAFSVMLYGLFLYLMVFGLSLNHWRVKGLGSLMKLPGTLATDFVTLSGMGVTLINMALLGFLATTYVLLIGGELNGPVIGGVFTVVGFGAFGKHIKNVIPVLLGVFLVKLVDVNAPRDTIPILGALFGTTLAPIAGRYGILAGIAAGALHMFMVGNLSYLHAGMNLYNNGFSGGFVAAALIPLFDAIEQIRLSRASGKMREKNGS